MIVIDYRIRFEKLFGRNCKNSKVNKIKDISNAKFKVEEEKLIFITIVGEKMAYKKLAWERLIEFISKVKINEIKVIGKYRNMDLDGSYNFY